MKPTKTSLFFSLLIALAGSAFSQTKMSPVLLRDSVSTKIERSAPFVEGKTIVEEVEYTGLDTDLKNYGVYLENALYETDFKKLLSGHGNTITEGDKFNEERVGSVIKLLKEWLAHNDYLKAEVIAYGTKLARNTMRLTFSVERGVPLDSPELNFVGAESISNQEFIDDFKKCSGDGWKSYELQKFTYYSQHCSQSFLFSKGFLRSKIPYTDRKLLDNHYLITFRVHEGPRFRWGDIKIDGAKEFSNKQLLEMFGQSTGDIADGRDLQDFVFDRLKRAYDELGYVQYYADFDPEIIDPKADDLDGVVNALITIDEGKQFRIDRIEFRGAGIDPDLEKPFKRDFPLRPGDVFVRSKFEAGIDAINKSGDYLFLDKDRDVEILSDESAATVDLIITLNKRVR